MNAQSKSIFLGLTFFLCSLALPAWGADKLELAGRVVDSAGEPVAGAEVYVYRSTNVKKPADFVSNHTEADGLYRVMLPSGGSYWAVAVLRRDGRQFGPLGSNDKHSGEPLALDFKDQPQLQEEFTVIDLREAARRTQKKNPELLKISGRILDSGGEPVAMAYAFASKSEKPEAMPKYLSTWTDRHGQYTLYLPAGEYILGSTLAFPIDNDYQLSERQSFGSDREQLDLTMAFKKKAAPGSQLPSPD